MEWIYIDIWGRQQVWNSPYYFREAQKTRIAGDLGAFLDDFEASWSCARVLEAFGSSFGHNRYTVETGSTKSDTIKQDTGSESKSATIISRHNALEVPADLQRPQVKPNASIPMSDDKDDESEIMRKCVRELTHSGRDILLPLFTKDGCFL
ncbi:hypothetical protein HanPI659440_Chr10g0372851 [Helianthus annuus]|nr:hypothetical protein HanPI659440_Chr10g0372851 [Helianthus annuus]